MSAPAAATAHPPGWLAAALGSGACASVRLATGEALFRQGDPARAIFQILAGRLVLIRHTIGGQRVLLHNACPGDLFAEASLFADAYHCDAAAAAVSEVRVIPKTALLDALGRDPALALGFAEALAHQVQALRGRLALRDLRPARERVLAGLALHVGPDRHTVRLPGTLLDLAAEIGLTHETLYRILARLEREALIERTDAGTIRLIRGGPAAPD
ncbi:MAG: Crp/Fnr family transcriptional regulator [Rhodospirillales bacterium]|nr:Crp/Fnr family transcriptional regulator [Rhodospirillales bacterium]